MNVSVDGYLIMVMYSLGCHKERQASVQGVHGDALFKVPQRSVQGVCMVVHSLRCHKERQASV